MDTKSAIHSTLRRACLVTSCAALLACGNRGPLYLPDGTEPAATNAAALRDDAVIGENPVDASAEADSGTAGPAQSQETGAAPDANEPTRPPSDDEDEEG